MHLGGHGGHDRGAFSGQPGQEMPHPGSAAAHVSEQTESRTPGWGEHQQSGEAHHLGPVPDNTRRLPEHELDPKVTNPLPSLPSNLGLPHNDKGPSAPSEEAQK